MIEANLRLVMTLLLGLFDRRCWLILCAQQNGVDPFPGTRVAVSFDRLEYRYTQSALVLRYVIMECRIPDGVAIPIDESDISTLTRVGRLECGMTLRRLFPCGDNCGRKFVRFEARQRPCIGQRAPESSKDSVFCIRVSIRLPIDGKRLLGVEYRKSATSRHCFSLSRRKARAIQ